MIKFNTKFTAEREFNRDKTAPSTLSAIKFAYESDRGRIINSAAIRRLQQKTQVFPLERNAAVRSRLTHSMEVQQVGRFIVHTIFNKLSTKGISKNGDVKQDIERYLNENNLKRFTNDKYPIEKTDLLTLFGMHDLESHFETITEMACLMHDIGNPPFGHFGEQAISDWFSKHIESIVEANLNTPDEFSENLKRDICHFEGNAQAIRLVRSIQALNLTYTQIASILKYTRCGTDPKPSEGKTNNAYLGKKVGYYHSEKDFVNTLCQQLDIKLGNRHPVCYIMEAADDISYCIADLEDAVDKKILTREMLINALVEEFDAIKSKFNIDSTAICMRKITQKANAKPKEYYTSQDSQFFISLRVSVLHKLVDHAADQFIKNIDTVYDGSYDNALLEDKSIYHALSKTLKNVAVKHVFCNAEVEAAELQGYMIIEGLLNCYKPLLLLPRTMFERVVEQHKEAPLLEKRLFKKLPQKHVAAYKKAIESASAQDEIYYRCRLLQDNISGMTDQFAYDEFRMMSVVD